MGLRNKSAWLQILDPLLSRDKTWGNIINLPKPQFLHLKMANVLLRCVSSFLLSSPSLLHGHHLGVHLYHAPQTILVPPLTSVLLQPEVSCQNPQLAWFTSHNQPTGILSPLQNLLLLASCSDFPNQLAGCFSFSGCSSFPWLHKVEPFLDPFCPVCNESLGDLLPSCALNNIKVKVKAA